MYELKKSEEINRLIAITKSDSGISGPELAKAHIKLGMAMGRQIMGLSPEDTTIVAMLRGGIFFAEGMYFAMGCRFQTYDPKHERFVRPETKNVILVDSVINTGKTLFEILDPDMKVACCVINEQAVPMFDDILYTVRVSKNSFVGKNVKKQEGKVGPDTTMRLFNQL
ncbi:MAG: phosphoribosyltransferase [Lacrimispora saccharolytica]